MRADCRGSKCRFGIGAIDFVEVSASNQPGHLTAWDGFSGEPLGGELATTLLCVESARVVDLARCDELTRVPRLFEQARARAEALRARMGAL